MVLMRSKLLVFPDFSPYPKQFSEDAFSEAQDEVEFTTPDGQATGKDSGLGRFHRSVGSPGRLLQVHLLCQNVLRTSREEGPIPLPESKGM